MASNDLLNRLELRVANLLDKREAMTARVRAAYQDGRWAKASPSEQYRVRRQFAIVRYQLSAAIRELREYRDRKAGTAP